MKSERKQYADSMRMFAKGLGILGVIGLIVVIVGQPADDNAPAPSDTKQWLIGVGVALMASLLIYFIAGAYEAQS